MFYNDSWFYFIRLRVTPWIRPYSLGICPWLKRTLSIPFFFNSICLFLSIPSMCFLPPYQPFFYFARSRSIPWSLGNPLCLYTQLRFERAFSEFFFSHYPIFPFLIFGHALIFVFQPLYLSFYELFLCLWSYVWDLNILAFYTVLRGIVDVIVYDQITRWRWSNCADVFWFKF